MDILTLIVVALAGYLLYGYMRAYDKLAAEMQKIQIALNRLKLGEGGTVLDGGNLGITPASELRNTFMNILNQLKG